MTTPQFDPNLLAYLQAWRQYLEQLAGAAAAPGLTVPGLAFPGLAIPGIPQMPLTPGPLTPPAMPPMPPAHPAAPSADYLQQLLNTLQAWRQYLESSMHTTAPAPTEAAPPATKVVVAPHRDDVSRVVPVPPPAGENVSVAGHLPAGFELPTPRVGSAYPSETGARAQGDYIQSTPKSLYSTAAQPTSRPTTEWWQAGSGPASDDPSAKTPTSKPEQMQPADAEQTQQSGPPEDGGGGGSATGVTPPDKLQHVAPLKRDLSQHPRLELIQPSRNLSR